MKKNKIQKIIHSKGYVSIETLIVTGLIIATGAFLISKLVWKGKDVAILNDNNMATAGKVMDDNSFTGGSGNSHNEVPSSQPQLTPKDDFTCDLENPSNLSDYKYKVIDDECINEIKSKINKGNEFLRKETEKDVQFKTTQLEKLKGGIILTGYHGSETNLKLPSCIDNKKVVAIGSYLLQDGVGSDDPPFMPSKNRSKKYSITIPNTVKFVHDFAFLKSNLVSVEIPNSVEYIGNSAFAYNELNKVNLPNNISNISVGTFENNTLSEIKIPNKVSYIGDGAFDNNKLTKLDIPSSVKHLSGFACNQISELNVPDSVEYVGGFKGNKISKLNMSNSIKLIGASAFSRNQLETVTIPDSVVKIDFSAFSDNKLTSVKLGKSLETIDDKAFDSTPGPIPSTPGNRISELTIPDSVKNIGECSFGRNDLREVTFLGSSLESINKNAFEGNFHVKTVNAPKALNDKISNVFHDSQHTSFNLK
ncbi:hypothetical protein BFS06_14110 [Clostridium perfringens]|uniref:leucine-rich repeat domain-containing protein n=1 Tax=Clostridium perfringens TaxID=1502 RepID=UPI00103DD04E|nr:leucine-rich repeat domain-containing protein [Clostridium perfringens]TBX14341.1 hypothetical protein BFS06_14110 [Clostridium perfringens]